MPRTRPIRTAFNAGEWSPRLKGRVDLQRYQSACETLENFYVLPQGGVTRRPGTRYVGNTKQDGEGRLFDFRFSSDQAFAVLFGERYMRLYRDDGVLTVPAVTNGIVNGDFSLGNNSWTDKSTGTASRNAVVSMSAVDRALGTVIGNATENGGLTVPFGEHADPLPAADCATRTAATTSVGKTWPAARIVSGFQLIGSSDQGLKRVENPTMRVRLQGSNDGFANSIVDLRDVNVKDENGVSKDIRNGVDVTAAYTSHRLKIQGGSSDRKIVISRVEFLEFGGPGRMALIGAADSVAAIEQQITSFTPETVNVLSFEFQGETQDSQIEVRIGTTSGGKEILSQFFRSGTHTIEFEPTAASSLFLQFRNKRNETVHVASVSILASGPYELITPYTAADARQLRMLGQRDIIWLAHRSGEQRPRRLVRNGTFSWSIEDVVFQDGPYEDEDPNNEIAIKSSGRSGNVTLTASEDLWKPGHVGTSWRIGPIGGVPGHATWATGDFDGQETTPGDYRKFESNVYRCVDDGGQNGNSPPVHEQGEVSDGSNIFRFVNRAGNGWVRITGYVSPTEVTARVMVELDPSAVEGLTKFVAPGTTVWREGAFSDERGWPTAVGLHEGRLVWSKDRKVCFSVVNDYERFTPTDIDSDAIIVTLAGETADEILWLVSEDLGLIAGTTEGPWIIRSNIQNDPLSPSNVRADPQTTFGSADIQPVKTPWSWMAIGPDARSMIELRTGVVDTGEEGVVGNDMTITADHILRAGVHELVYARSPHSLVVAVREDGVLATLTYQRDQEVIGWARQVFTGGAVESACVIPGTLAKRREDEIWLLVRRTIDGTTRRFIEVVQRSVDYDGVPSDAWLPDAGIVYEGDPVTTITGLDHLEGEIVKVAVDGADHPARVVENGEIELEAAASKAVVGLVNAYRLKSLKIAEGGQVGAAVHAKKRASHIVAGFSLSLTARVGFVDEITGQSLVDLTFRQVADEVNAPPPLFNGEIIESLPAGWGVDPRIVIAGDDAMPLTVTHVVLDDLDTQELR